MQLLSSVVTVGACAFSLKKSIEQEKLWPYAAFVAAFVGMKKLKEILTPNPTRMIPDWKERKEKDQLVEEILEWLKTPGSTAKNWLRNAERLLGANFDNLSDKRILVILCPTAGTGQALHYWENVVRHVLNAFGITNFTVRETEYVHHATEIASANLDEYDAIAHFGGDGTAYEVFQGLYHREKGGPRLDFPMAYFGCGSANATGCSVIHANPSFSQKGDATMIDSCLPLARWNIVPFDLMEFQIRFVDGKVSRNISHITCIFGTTAHYVKLANSLRWTKLGSYRYDLMSYWSIINNHEYSFDWSILPEEKTDHDVPTLDNWKVDERWIKLLAKLQLLTVMNFWCANPDPRRNTVQFSDGCLYIHYVAGLTRLRLWRDCFGSSVYSAYYHDIDEPHLFPEGLSMMRAKAVQCKFLGPKNDWKRKVFFYDGEFEDRYVDEFRITNLPSAARIFSCD